MNTSWDLGCIRFCAALVVLTLVTCLIQSHVSALLPAIVASIGTFVNWAEQSPKPNRRFPMLQNLIKFLGQNAILSLITTNLIGEAKSQGHDGVERALDLPEAVVTSLAVKAGKDPAEALRLRDVASSAEADFITYFVPLG